MKTIGKFGLVLVVVGIAMVVVSQTVPFTKTMQHVASSSFDFSFNYNEEDVATKHLVLYGGITVFLIGGVLTVLGISPQKKNND